jgi:hypothetical protein
MLDGVLQKRSTSQEARSMAYGHHRVEKIKSKTINFIPKKFQLHFSLVLALFTRNSILQPI